MWIGIAVGAFLYLLYMVELHRVNRINDELESLTQIVHEQCKLQHRMRIEIGLTALKTHVAGNLQPLTKMALELEEKMRYHRVKYGRISSD